MPNPDHDRSNLDEVRRNVLTNNYDRLLRQYQATAEQAALNLNPSARIALEEEANNLLQQLEKVDQELRQLPIPPEGKGFLPFSGWQIDGLHRKGFGDFMEKLSTCKIPILPSPKP
jgi:hypothetical protein